MDKTLQNINIVWFKRDLRIIDNAALSLAAKAGDVLPLYILEPELWQQPDVSRRQYQFLRECLNELNLSLKKLGQPLIIKVGDAVEILEKIKQKYKINSIYSHQETWNGWTFERDKKVKKWTKANNISWFEPTQNGVVRCLKDRNGWANRWQNQMRQTIFLPPKSLNLINQTSDILPKAQDLGLVEDGCIAAQKGGRSQGLELLKSFLYQRGEHYSKEMSSPITAFTSCSRLSAHLAFGTLSIREVFQTAQKRSEEIKMMPRGAKGKWPSAVWSFSGRLRWHCHFIQKLEDEPRIEFENMHRAYDGLRENDFNQDFFAAWKAGKTGYPMVDACMRALIATGWLNFRMRAMLMSFASYHLWLNWRKTSLHLAQLFIDYEPGIHYSQTQMQSGTTGINSVRIYNPIKQGIDQDPDGIFIRKWVAELKDMPQEFIHTPWQCPEKLGNYPLPIVEEKSARKSAAEKLYALRKNSTHKQEAKKIVTKHGSRKSGLPRTVGVKKTKKVSQNKQMDLFS